MFAVLVKTGNIDKVFQFVLDMVIDAILAVTMLAPECSFEFRVFNHSQTDLAFFLMGIYHSL
jgi:hypothetical protein